MLKSQVLCEFEKTIAVKSKNKEFAVYMLKESIDKLNENVYNIVTQYVLFIGM